ncbi:hypothetical protein Ahy_A06g030333 [Arachis hypogaea]|uniref:2Fe-2S ferredoxin-type domain-containing protein n=1 Tax=Arachis hypogaea TaxID=3818 RepID=A0A445CVY0_ARAHY|nr:hypothetical protein Ahy_A06g030333 [Arachis hypogaea]
MLYYYYLTASRINFNLRNFLSLRHLPTSIIISSSSLLFLRFLRPLHSSSPLGGGEGFVIPSSTPMLSSRLPRLGPWIAKRLFTRNYASIYRGRYNQSTRNRFLQPPAVQFQQLSLNKLYNGAMIGKHNFLSTTSNEGNEQKETISVTFVDKDGEEQHIRVPVGMGMRGLTCMFNLPCYSHEYYNKLEDPTDEENDMLDLAFGLSETSRLGCQVIAKPELDGIRLAIPAATRNFAVDGYVPKPH